MEQLIFHLFGDYVFQSDYMAQGKTKFTAPAFWHALVYSLLFILIVPSFTAWLVIFGTHFLIDRFRLARYIVWFKNLAFAPIELWYDNGDFYDCSCGVCNFCEGKGAPYGIREKYQWQNCSATGYPADTPPFLAVWLLIIADNALHLLINFLAIKYL